MLANQSQEKGFPNPPFRKGEPMQGLRQNYSSEAYRPVPHENFGDASSLLISTTEISKLDTTFYKSPIINPQLSKNETFPYPPPGPSQKRMPAA